MRSTRTNIFYKTILKRVIDFSLALIICILFLSWLIPLLAFLIKLSSKGSVFFLQERTGLNNSAFKIIKFRTMLVNADSDKKQACYKDERITNLGSILRKYSIDELPQIINVLKGDMSFVGPRPHMLFHTDKYTKLNKNFALRGAVLPGITGLAQVMGFRGEIKNEFMLNNRIRYDLYYNKNLSFKLDVFILLKTVQILIMGDSKAKVVAEVNSGKQIV